MDNKFLIAGGLAVAGILFLVLQAKAEPGVWECPYCGATFATYEELAIHIRDVHETGLYPCPYCSATFDTYEELVAHCQAEHPGERIPIEIIWD